MVWASFLRKSKPNPGAELAAIGIKKRADQAKSHRQHVRETCRDICAATGKVVPDHLRD